MTFLVYVVGLLFRVWKSAARSSKDITNAVKNIWTQRKMHSSVKFYNPGLALTGFRTTWSCLQKHNLTRACDPIENQHLISDELKKKQVPYTSAKLEPAIWSRNTGEWVRYFNSRCAILKKDAANRGCMSLVTYQLDYGRYLARLLRRRRENAPTVNTAGHDNPEKTN